MSVNLYNAERYLDPTAYEALMNIEREAKRTAYKPLVFICSPFAGNIERNTRRARDFCRFAVSENCIPIAPHLLFPQFMEESDPQQRRLGLSDELLARHPSPEKALGAIYRQSVVRALRPVSRSRQAFAHGATLPRR